VNDVVDSSSVQYAVIAGLRTETGSERLVIAYPNEESLRDLIAEPSIIAVGFSSREEAAAGSRGSGPTAIVYQQMTEAIGGGRTKGYQQGLDWVEWPGEIGSTLRTLARFLVTSYGAAVSTVSGIFFSKNAVSAVIRIALGSSV